MERVLAKLGELIAGQSVRYRQLGDGRVRRAIVLAVHNEHVTLRWRGSWREESCQCYWLDVESSFAMMR
jgi:hypothetical protein